MILIIDLDNTIYQASRGVLKAIDRRMSKYMIDFLGFTEENADRTRIGYWKTHGTTMKGLKADYNIDEADFMKYVHDIPVEKMLNPDVELKRILSEIKHPKFIFTNADLAHASIVLNSLDITEQFERIFNITDLEFVGKPYAKAYEFVETEVIKILNGKLSNTDKLQFVFFDDYPQYLASAKTQGWTTVHVDESEESSSRETEVREGGIEPFIDYTVKTIHSIKAVVEHIERKKADSEGVSC